MENIVSIALFIVLMAYIFFRQRRNIRERANQPIDATLSNRSVCLHQYDTAEPRTRVHVRMPPKN